MILHSSSPEWHDLVLLLIQSEGPTTLIVSSISDKQQHLRKMKNFSTETFENPGMVDKFMLVQREREKERKLMDTKFSAIFN